MSKLNKLVTGTITDYTDTGVVIDGKMLTYSKETVAFTQKMVNQQPSRMRQFL